MILAILNEEFFINISSPMLAVKYSTIFKYLGCVQTLAVPEVAPE